MNERIAVIYLDGLNSLNAPMSARELAKYLSRALEHKAGTRTARFVLGKQRLVRYGQEGRYEAPVQTLLRMDGTATTGEVDIYRVDYLSSLVERLRNRSPALRIVMLCLNLLQQSLSLLRACLRRGTSRLKFFDLAVASGWVVLVLADLLFVVSGMVSADWLQEHVHLASAAAAQWIDAVVPGFVSSTGIVGSKAAIQVWVGAHLGALLLSGGSARTRLSSATAGYGAMLEYVMRGEGRSAATAHVPNLLEQLDNDEVVYDEIHLMGYSFGSIVALDTVFPAARTRDKAIDELSSVTTIGCPLEACVAIVPKYFHQRYQTTATSRWTNVYLDRDPLSTTPPPERTGVTGRGVRLAEGNGERRPHYDIDGREWGKQINVGVVATFLLGGMRVHSAYWEEDSDAPSCFDPLVVRLFENRTVSIRSTS